MTSTISTTAVGLPRVSGRGTSSQGDTMSRRQSGITGRGCWALAAATLTLAAVALATVGPTPVRALFDGSAGGLRASAASLDETLAPDQAAPGDRALPNGLAATPQMGWNDWNAYRCDVSEELVKRTADKMVSSGMLAAGYQYVNIDDCWSLPQRDGSGNLVADPAKFPGGMKALADYVHGKGLKLGIYSSAGKTTCAGFPGGLGNEKRDADLWASWGIDYLKYDNCPADDHGGLSAQRRYTAMRDALAATGRKILFSLCNWGEEEVWTWGRGIGNSWRTTGDSRPTFDNLLARYRANVPLSQYAGPGAWNDPDMLETGNGMTVPEERAEFSLWAQMAAPLISGSNLVDASAGTLSILTNKAVIAVDQDRLGRQGRLVSSAGGLDVLAKPLANGDVSVVLFNQRSVDARIATTAAAVGKSGMGPFALTDLWSGRRTSTTGDIAATVPAHGVAMYRVHGGGGGGGQGKAVLRGVVSKRCVEVPKGTDVAETRVALFDCNGGVNQRWTATSAKQLRVYDNSCLDAFNNGTGPGTAVQIFTCHSGKNQQWTLGRDHTVRGVESGLCLDSVGAATSNGTKLVLNTCNGKSSQRWSRT
jgi:alpha-galactosidase